MSIVAALQAALKVDRQPTCLGCRHFLQNPREIEEMTPGLTALSSGFASVRADDGFCRVHGVYSNGRRACASREPL